MRYEAREGVGCVAAEGLAPFLRSAPGTCRLGAHRPAAGERDNPGRDLAASV